MNATQSWLTGLTIMQQSALLSAIRGPDCADPGSVKPIVKWLRRCVLVSAFDRETLNTPIDPRGGAFTGASYVPNLEADLARMQYWEPEMDRLVDRYVHDQNFLPQHYTSHLLGAIEILGYKHPNQRIRQWWNKTYLKLVRKAHLNPESEDDLDRRTNDDEETWFWRNKE
jgi:hypothetical protein